MTALETTAAAAETHSSGDQLKFRSHLARMFEESPLPATDLIANLGLYIRGSLLVKFIFINSLYERIIHIPGTICEFGTWWGQNLVLFENLRAIHEPFNKNRRIIGFDTFTGYHGFTDKDKPGEILSEGSYSTGVKYKQYLGDLLAIHEGNNILGHLRSRHTLIDGDVSKTAPEYFQAHPEMSIALAYFDMGLYEPTKAALLAIKPHLIPGSVLVLDEFTMADAPGEALAFKEVFKHGEYRIERPSYSSMRAIVTIN